MVNTVCPVFLVLGLGFCPSVRFFRVVSWCVCLSLVTFLCVWACVPLFAIATSYGLPDLGITEMNDVLVDVRRITKVTKLPLLVDIDTGFGSAFNIARCVAEMERAGAAAVHIEDQAGAKRCGHRPNKQIVSQAEMVDRIKACVSGRTDPSFVIMARTDALANEGMAACIARSKAYVAAGADMLFPGKRGRKCRVDPVGHGGGGTRVGVWFVICS